MKSKLKTALFCALASCFSASWAAAPSGYYTTCEGYHGKDLLKALHNVIGDHSTVSYSGLWNLYKESDIDSNGKIWDMYSTKRWKPGSEQCGSYSAVGDCYNREHSFPKSWFNDASPMVSDAFHIYPTDGKVNNQRSNYPYGECASGTTLSSSGGVKALGKLGKSTFPGYSGTVFEPDDEYKGDFARSYFYMATCYNDRISSWNSDMLAHNSYPVFSTWAIDLLLKWHRQDPVSEKEKKRNDVVYNHQHNRNPYIDYPELAEHIWGNLQSQDWSASGTIAPAFTSPVNGTTVNIGTTSTGVGRSYTLIVKGAHLSSDATITTTGTGFSTNTSTLSASAINGSGASLTVSYKSATPGNATGTLVIKSGTASVSVNLAASAVNGLPALPATSVSENGFTARWSYVTDDETYTLDVKRANQSITGYPREVVAENEEYEVTGLEAETTYTYTLSSGSLTSGAISVTTAAPNPSIQLVYNGQLSMLTKPGIPSEPIEIGIEAENIPGDIKVNVDAPFEVSTDKATWSTTTSLSPEEDYFYLRINSEAEGNYATYLRLSSGSYVDDETLATGAVRSTDAQVETFDNMEDDDERWVNTYINGGYQGTAFKWKLGNTGVFSSDGNLAYEGNGCARLGKDKNSSIAMDEDLTTGAGTVSFMLEPWSSTDGDVTIEVQYSTDGGKTWSTAGDITAPKESKYTEYSVTVNHSGTTRIKLQQTAGKRALIDNVKITPAIPSGINNVDIDARNWDAYCLGGNLVIEPACTALFNVYSIDARAVYTGTIGESTTLTLPAGYYIIVSGDNAKRVVIK